MKKFILKNYVLFVVFILSIALTGIAVFGNVAEVEYLSVTNTNIVKLDSSFNYTAMLNYVNDFKSDLINEEEITYNATANLKVSSNYFKGYTYTSTLEEEIVIDFDNTIYAEDGIMDIILNVDATEFEEQIDVTAFYDFNEEGDITGIFHLGEETYSIESVLLAISDTEEIEDCFVLSFTAICVIVGAVIGATAGGIAAWKIAKAKNVSHEGTIWLVVGGVFVGAAIGALIGYGVGTVGTKIFAALAKSGSTKVAQSAGYNSFNAFKAANGAAGKDMAWHHIVTQQSSNITKFGAQKIHNAANLIKIPEGAGSLHRKITALYNSINPAITGSKTLRIGEWLATKSFDFQYKFGIEKLIELAAKMGVKIFLP